MAGTALWYQHRMETQLNANPKRFVPNFVGYNRLAPLGTRSEAPPQYTRYRLLGTLMHTRPCDTHAILFETHTQTVHRIHEGDTLDNGHLTVSCIQPKQVRLTDTNGLSSTLELEPQRWLGPRY